MAVRPCWNCRQPATHTLTRDGSIPLDACNNCTRIDRARAEQQGWTITPITTTERSPMDFHTALNNVIADLTPQPWDYTTPDGTTLRVIPAGLTAGPGCAEVLVRITRPDATGLGDYGITGPNTRGVAEVGVTTTDLPKVIEALTEQGWWADNTLVSGALLVAAASGGVVVGVTEDHGAGQHVDVGIVLPEAQRLPLASALSRALDVARSWES